MEMIRQYYKDTHAANIIIKDDGSAVVTMIKGVPKSYGFITSGEYTKAAIRYFLSTRLWEPWNIDLNLRYGITPDGRNIISCLKATHGAKPNNPFYFLFEDEALTYEDIERELYRPYPTHYRIWG
ncbi:MAG: hypothetical protein IJI65_00955 [Lachnospiraceae bacterium]|nr:hypothetical protein [Lachnospiraceae bacterium]